MTDSWNQTFIDNTKGLPKFQAVLEIGAYEGKTSRYICENMLLPGGKLIVVDPLQDEYIVENVTEEAKKLNSEFTFFKGQYQRFMDNTYNLPIWLCRETFAKAIPNIDRIKFDFIYIDGDHRAEAVYFDAVNSFKLLKEGAYILFDDYLWGTTDVKAGVDRFVTEYGNQIIEILKNYQVLIQKIN